MKQQETITSGIAIYFPLVDTIRAGELLPKKPHLDSGGTRITPDLEGRCVLCVGGLAALYTEYRRVVETAGGKLLIYRGDQQHESNCLLALLACADALLCPIDCVNHAAYFAAIQYCKHSGKPCALLKRSDLPTFRKGVEVLAASATTVAKSAQKHATVQARRNHCKARLAIALHGALICFGVVTMLLSHSAYATTTIAVGNTLQAFSISADSLEDALNRFAKQTGIKISFSNIEVKGLMTQGLNGNFTIQDGLKHLLVGSNLEMIPQADGFTVKRTSTPTSGLDSAIPLTVLPVVKVMSSAMGGYAAAYSTTATKTNTLLRDIPQSITVVTRELIRDQSMQSMADVARYVPGVGVSQGEGNRDALVFRGNRSTGDFFTDGVRDDVQYFRDLYNIERVEVLKGANGMIFGRGGSGGVINRVTKQAGWDPIREFSFEGGSFDKKRGTVDVGHAINDVAAVRFNSMYENSGSYRNGVNLERFGINPTVTLKPSHSTNIILGMEHFQDHRTSDRGIPSLNGAPVNTHSSTFFGDPRRSKSDVTVTSFNSLIEHKFDSGFTFRNRTNYAMYDKFYQNVFANSAVNSAGNLNLSAYNDSSTRDNFFNQTDFSYSLNTGPIQHTLAVGVEVGRQVTDNIRRNGTFSSGSTSLAVPLSNPITADPITFATRTSDADNHSVTKITSVYVQDQIVLLPQLHAIVGVRYDQFQVDFLKRNTSTNLKTDDGLLSPRLGLIYKPIEQISIYTSYSKAFAPRAAEQLTGLTVTTAALSPEKFTNVEAGVKWDILPNLAFTTAVYQIDRTNVISVDPNNSALTFLTKGQVVKGVEAGISGQITSAWRVMGGYAFQDGELLSTQSTTTARNGATLAELPRHTFSMWNRYDFTPMWGAAFGVIHRSDMFAALDNTVRAQGFTRVDAAIFARIDKRLRFQVNIENLLDTKYIAAVHNNNNMTPGSPIAVRASAIFNF
ncbi:MAG: putative TonB-dependent receptor BfrD [Nitrosomonadaceae bacterium]|nr:TonB-dependent siderophore receptor [Nitrosospira sp.]MBI0413266.1 TonB-dependent siderophore receptor [Nitrosospira sp.]MCG3771335.1 putative TonB-dependent receptor BfrD [Nitrosomonadaceae bacterium]